MIFFIALITVVLFRHYANCVGHIWQEHGSKPHPIMLHAAILLIVFEQGASLLAFAIGMHADYQPKVVHGTH